MYSPASGSPAVGVGHDLAGNDLPGCRHGTDLGLTVHPVSDCVAAASDAIHCASLANLDLPTAGCLTAAQVLELLRGSPPE